jgi:hypothetical protein
MITKGFNPQDDPLGLAVSGRARERRLKMQMTGGGNTIGPLPDPQWDAFFQAADEAGGGRHMRFGQDTTDTPLNPADSLNAMNAASPFDVKPMAPSNQLGTIPPATSIASLHSLKRRGR